MSAPVLNAPPMSVAERLNVSDYSAQGFPPDFIADVLIRERALTAPRLSVSDIERTAAWMKRGRR